MLIPLVPTNFELAAPTVDDQPAAASEPGASSESVARVIEFYVPATFQLPERRWVPAEERGKLIMFTPRRVRKSA